MRDHPPQPSIRIGPPEEPKPELAVSSKQTRTAPWPTAVSPETGRGWARLIKKIHEATPQGSSRSKTCESPLCCPRCHKPIKIIAVVTDPAQVLKILRHLINKGTPTRVPVGVVCLGPPSVCAHRSSPTPHDLSLALRFPPQSVSGHPYPCGGALLPSSAEPPVCPSDPTASYSKCYPSVCPSDPMASYSKCYHLNCDIICDLIPFAVPANRCTSLNVPLTDFQTLRELRQIDAFCCKRMQARKLASAMLRGWYPKGCAGSSPVRSNPRHNNAALPNISIAGRQRSCLSSPQREASWSTWTAVRFSTRSPPARAK